MFVYYIVRMWTFQTFMKYKVSVVNHNMFNQMNVQCRPTPVKVCTEFLHDIPGTESLSSFGVSIGELYHHCNGPWTKYK